MTSCVTHRDKAHPLLRASAVWSFVLLAAACSDGGNPVDGDTGATSEPATADIEGAQIDTAPRRLRPHGTYAGELEESLEQYARQNAQGFFELVDNAFWIGAPKRDRDCKGDPACSTTKVKVKLQAIQDANDVEVDPPAKLPKYGVVIAKMRNHGNHVEAVYDLKPGNWETYIVIRPVTDSTGTIVSIEQRLADLYLGEPKRLEIRQSPGAFYVCHKELKWPIPYADFRGCSRGASGGSRQAPADTGPGATVSSRALAWMTCAQGCCTSEYPLLQSDTTRVLRP